VKVAVYAIALNEAQHIERWAKSCEEADVRLLLDTGSSDSTVALAKKCGVVTHTQTFDPWRFDVARNRSVELIPDDIDYCIALDVDEVLLPGWRESLEEAFRHGWTRPRYSYTWSWNADGSPGLVYGGDKIHTRHGYKWKHPVHEVLVSDNPETHGWLDLEIHHHPDPTKSRGQYLPLLEMAAKESPDDDRTAHYLGREYLYMGRHEDAARELRRHLSLPSAVWLPERAQSMRFLARVEPENAESWLLKAAAEAPEHREAWVDLAEHYYNHFEWPGCLYASEKALAITEKPLIYFCEADAWGAKPYDLAALACFNMGIFAQAVEYGQKAVDLQDDERLVLNLRFYSKAVI
jgi:tetratricopeptide (TPR) repeat protein